MSDSAADPADFGMLLDAQTLRFERELPGPIERVWAYITEPDKMATWIAAIDIPHEVGATFEHRWSTDDDAGGEPGGVLHGIVREFRPPHVLEYAWTETLSPQGAVRDSVVRYELADDGDGWIRLTLTHQALPLRTYASFGAGWHAHLDTLRAQLTGAKGPDADERYDMLAPQYGDIGLFSDIGTVRLVRELPGTLAEVWNLLTTRDGLRRWIGDGAVPTKTGSRFTITLQQDDVRVDATLLAYEANRALEYTWETPFDPTSAEKSVVRFALEPREDEVILTIEHRKVLPDYLGRVGAGWHALSDRLNAALYDEAAPEFMDAFARVVKGYDGLAAGGGIA
jgi:uncharacterized protein YndB with AHSA1/START domain